jgi:hypothetical protein
VIHYNCIVDVPDYFACQSLVVYHDILAVLVNKEPSHKMVKLKTKILKISDDLAEIFLSWYSYGMYSFGNCIVI